jgi:DNA-binding transcriptional ArsR family regulator
MRAFPRQTRFLPAPYVALFSVQFEARHPSRGFCEPDCVWAGEAGRDVLGVMSGCEWKGRGTRSHRPSIRTKKAQVSLDRLRRPRYFTFRLISHVAKYMPDQLSTTFAALSDPTRRAILARLALGETSVKELSGPFAISAPSITKHLKVLERAGLIRRGRDAQWRPCRLEAAPLRAVSEWVENYRRFWDEKFSRLDQYLSDLQEKEKRHARTER